MTVTPCDTPEALATALTGAGSKLVREVVSSAASKFPCIYDFCASPQRDRLRPPRHDTRNDLPSLERLHDIPYPHGWCPGIISIPPAALWVCGRCVCICIQWSSFVLLPVAIHLSPCRKYRVVCTWSIQQSGFVFAKVEVYVCDGSIRTAARSERTP